MRRQDLHKGEVQPRQPYYELIDVIERCRRREHWLKMSKNIAVG